MSKTLTYKPFGERAVLIEWEAKISEEILRDITVFKSKIQSDLNDKIENCIVGYHSLTVVFKEFIDHKTEVQILQKLYHKKGGKEQIQNFLWKIPVCYDGSFGIDLEELSLGLKLPKEKIIQLHTSTTYKVYFVGFLPGFLYLGGLDKRLHFPRKSNPRLKVLKGSVAIGGSQTGVYPQESAGGWNLIGNTPVNFFDVEKDTPCFAKTGDKIQFEPISFKEYENIQSEIIKGTYKLTKTKIYD